MRSTGWVFLFVFVTLIFSTKVMAGLSGKIVGRIYDQDLNLPMSNVEITLLNTPYKTHTDTLGNYGIINIPPGIYRVQAWYLGYVPAITENVSINVDQTAIADFRLSSTIIELGRTDTTRQRIRLVNRNETCTFHKLNSIELSLLPIETLQDLIKILPGVSIDPAGYLHNRNGRANEILFLNDGLLNINPLSQSMDYDVPTEEIDEIVLKTGAFNAEYGNALSGVANILTHKISKPYTGYISFQTGDVLSFHSKQFSDEIKTIDPLNNMKIQGAFGGPVPKLLKDRLYFYVSTRYWENKGYLYGKRLNKPDGEFVSDLEDAEFVALNPLKKFNLTNKISYRIKPNMTLLYAAFYKYNEGQSCESEEDYRWKFLPDSKLWHYSQGNSQNLIFSHQTGKKLNYALSASYWWDKSWSHTFDSADSPDYVWPWDTQKDALNEFYIKGTQNNRRVQNASTLASKFDLNWQINLRHEFKTGFDFKRHDISSHSYFIAAPETGSDQTANIANPDSINDRYQHHPMEFSFYLQDKIEWPHLILNLGLRMDGFVPDADAAADWTRPDTSNVVSAKSKFRISPRFSVVYPFLDRGKVFFAYGHYFQAPRFWALYSNQGYQRCSHKYLPIFGNGDLTPEKTIDYELGFDLELSHNFALGVKAFHRDFRDFPGHGVYSAADGLPYAVLKNCDFGYAWGAIISFQQRFSKFMSIHLDYTYQNAKSNDSEIFFGQKLQNGTNTDKLTKNLFSPDYLQPHSLKILWQFANPESWGIGLYGRIESGYPYTPKVLYNADNVESYNSERSPAQFNFDIKLYKTFGVWLGRKETKLTLFLKCYNLLDNLNEEIVWPSSGHADKPTTLFSGKMSDEWVNRPYWYSKPREILTGIKYEF